MAAWSLLLIYAVVLLKPAEFVPALASVPLVHLVFGCGLVLTSIELGSGRLRWDPSPALGWVLAFFGWAVFITLVKHPDGLSRQLWPLVITGAIHVLASVAFGSASGLRVFRLAWVGCALTVSIVALAQAASPPQCVIAEADDWQGKGDLQPDGRPCESLADCREEGQPELNYRCEHVGPWGTTSVGQRVRYRGSLGDPNELSLMVGTAIPLLWVSGAGASTVAPSWPSPSPAPFPSAPMPPGRLSAPSASSLVSTSTGLGSRILRLAFLALILAVVLLSRSRGGILVVSVALGMELLRRFRAWGLIGVGAALPPLLLLGGRSGEDAEASSEDRVELLREAFEFLRRSHGFGMGLGQFADSSSLGLTAHNSFLLAATEAGLLGLWLFGVALYLTLKVPYVLWLGASEAPLSPPLRRYARGLALGLTGAVPGIAFLSWTYKDVLYLLFAGSGALHAAARREAPGLRFRVSALELLAVALASVATLGAFRLGLALRK